MKSLVLLALLAVPALADTLPPRVTLLTPAAAKPRMPGDPRPLTGWRSQYLDWGYGAGDATPVHQGKARNQRW